MTIVVNTERVHQLMQARGMDISGLARSSGMSRQGVYRLLSKDYHPLGRGLQAVAAALGISPLTLLAGSADDVGGAEILQLVAQAAQGEPRAFELLPALLHQATPAAWSVLEQLSPLQHQLLAAAAELVGELTSSVEMVTFAAQHAQHREPGRAFFFASRFMPVERIMDETPEPMKRHLVFGSFNIDSFRRHF